MSQLDPIHLFIYDNRNLFQDTTMTQSDDTKPESRPKSTHGGRRAGSGRKPSPFGSPVAKKIPRNLLPMVESLIQKNKAGKLGVVLTTGSVPLDALVVHPNPSKLDLPIATEKIPAGFASPAEGYIEDYLDFNEYLVRNPSSTIIARCGGYSMLDAGIDKDDLLVIDRAITPSHRDIVMADLGSQYTIKRLHILDDGCVELHSENSRGDERYPNYTFSDGDELAIVGVVMHVIKDVRKR